jgi:hypothetical protein
MKVDEHDDMYIECLFRLKSHITEVYLQDDNEEEPCMYLKICDELCRFPNLQSVCIDQSFDISSRNIMDYVEYMTVHDNLMHLEKLELTLTGHNFLRLPFKELHNIKPTTKIKDVSIIVSSCQDYDTPNEQCMLYIMKKFPNPSRIQLLMNGNIIDPRVTNIQNQEYTK